MGAPGLPRWLSDKEPPANAGDAGSIPGSGRSPGGGHGNLLQYSCLENPHGQRSLVGYSPWGHRDLDMAKRLSTAQYYTYTIYDIYIIYHIISVVDKYCYMFNTVLCLVA